jgi:hypothetical protein
MPTTQAPDSMARLIASLRMGRLVMTISMAKAAAQEAQGSGGKTLAPVRPGCHGPNPLTPATQTVARHATAAR